MNARFKASRIAGAVSPLLIAMPLFLTSSLALADPHNKKVDCDKNQSLSHAILTADHLPMTIYVSGTCNENVFIDRRDLTLIGDPVATINGVNPAENTVTISAERVTLNGMRVTGGLNGISVSGGDRALIVNMTVDNTSRNGINFFQGGNGTVQRTTASNNGRSGVRIESGSATVINSRMTGNADAGVHVANGGSARIGIDNRGTTQPNDISNNGNNGIHINGATAFINGNTITGNGTDPAAGGLGRNGIGVFHSTAIVVGGNTISGNYGAGIFANRNSGVFVGDPNFNLPTVNTISGNGLAGAPVAGAGIFGFLNSSFDIRDATITGNNGGGLVLRLRSVGRIQTQTVPTTITGNGGPGDIRLELGSALRFDGGPATFGTISCTDTESSISPGPLTEALPPPPACSGF
jgi:hypothetical protein